MRLYIGCLNTIFTSTFVEILLVILQLMTQQNLKYAVSELPFKNTLPYSFAVYKTVC